MATEVILPKFGFSMTEGTIVEWLVADGGTVTEGEILFALEADKATQEVEAPASGTLKIIVPAGEEDVPVGTVIGSIE
jgi:pyruvate/2-oxoglutarate dehydrogenase complex dihydrolipoamide acyltransferase (E2) component